uniref:Uncharacterized protein n=1 Tax=Rhizophora mucronata TaxID=61149 RepID=A0A2P2PD99_RHIMU
MEYLISVIIQHVNRPLIE